MAMNTVRRIASQILKVGESKVKFKPSAVSKIGDALTREDVRERIKEGEIYALSVRGVCRARSRKKKAQVRKGRRKGKGSRKGTFNARRKPKESWIAKVRSQRAYLFGLREDGKLKEGEFRRIYLMVKGNAFRGVNFLRTYLEENKLVEKENVKASKKK